MIIMDVKVDNLYAFKNFHMNMSYPKKIIDSTIPEEYLIDRPNFRYKKVNIIMGGNATGKTSLGKLLMLCANYFKDGSYKRFANVVDDKEKDASLSLDFVTDKNMLYRLAVRILKSQRMDGGYKEEDSEIAIRYVEINKKDNYETCARKLETGEYEETTYDRVKTNGWYFSYPQDVFEIDYEIEDQAKYLYILENVLKTLDPSIRQVIKVKEVEKTFAIIYDHQSVIIKDGKINNSNILSSGTKAGIDIAYIITSLYANRHDFYYCDERLSFVNSDVEKACLSVMIEKLKDRKQLFFTTHNTEILEMQLPKHTYTFLKKDVDDDETPIKTIYASDYLKRNTDSLKCAVENDLFGITSDLDRLFEIDNL